MSQRRSLRKGLCPERGQEERQMTAGVTGACREHLGGAPKPLGRLREPGSSECGRAEPVSGPWTRLVDAAGEGPTLPAAPASALAAESLPRPLCWPPTPSSLPHSAPLTGPGHGTAEHRETQSFHKMHFWYFRQSHIERAWGASGKWLRAPRSRTRRAHEPPSYPNSRK